jgi:hypothetical protein
MSCVRYHMRAYYSPIVARSTRTALLGSGQHLVIRYYLLYFVLLPHNIMNRYSRMTRTRLLYTVSYSTYCRKVRISQNRHSACRNKESNLLCECMQHVKVNFWRCCIRKRTRSDAHDRRKRGYYKQEEVVCIVRQAISVVVGSLVVECGWLGNRLST